MPNINEIVVSTGASAVVSAAHRARDGSMHGHTWEITAWWAEGADATTLKKMLEDYLGVFDHAVLGDELAWGEALAKAALLGLGCVKVEVRRPLERLYAVAELRR